MIWLSWRQFRLSALVATIGLLGVLVVLAVPRPSTGFLTTHHLLQFLSTFMVGLPALIGAFWGAPLVGGEVESGTYRLAWTQSVPPTRWLAVKLALVGAASVATTGLLTVLLTVWSSTSDGQGRFGTAMFAQRGVVPMAYSLFGFTLGVAAGLAIKRVLAAMATTIVVFAVVRIVIQNWVRPLFDSPIAVVLHGNAFHLPAGSWTVSDDVYTQSGHIVTQIRCGPSQGGNGCMAGMHEVIRYQPPSRYWMFQSLESAVVVGLSLALAGACLWVFRRRTTA